jgi:NADH dehydrogenase, FAD-containing subunit
MGVKKVIILGGGYGGVHTGQYLNRLFRGGSEIEITIINKDPYHTLLTELHEVAGLRIHPEAVRISLDRIFKKTSVKIVQDIITNVDINSQVLMSEKGQYPYDYLILSFGSQPAFFGIPGMEEHAFSLWSFEDALRVKNQIQDMFNEASKEDDRAKRQELLTFIVGGGGFTGIEMMGELMDWVLELCEEYDIDRNEIKLLVVEAMSKILTNLTDKSIQKSVSFFNKNGVEILTGSPISKVNHDSIELGSGRIIKSRTLIWTGGIQNDSLSQKLNLKLGKRGRIEANEYMQSIDHKNIYVVGDNVSFNDPEAGPLLPLVETALQTGECAARNIYNDITGRGKTKLILTYHGVMVSLGGSYSVSEIGGVKLSYVFSDIIKHFVNIHYLFGVGGLSFAWDYILDNFLRDKRRRTFAGGLLYGKTSGLWLTALRMFLGIMWLKSGIEKVHTGWLSGDILSASASVSLIGPTTPEWYANFVKTVVIPNAAAFQYMITLTEILLGIALFFGGLTMLAAFGAIVMDLNFFLSGTGDWWILVVSIIVLLSNAGMYFGADYFLIPLLKSWLRLDIKKYSIKAAK